MYKKLITSLVPVVLAFYSSVVFSQNIQILNRNFDSDAIPPNPGYLSWISGWVNSGYGSIGVKAPLGSGVNYHNIGDHGQVGYLQQGARLTQTADTELQNGETYTLTFDAGKPIGSFGQDFIVRFKADGLALAQTQFDSASVIEGEWSNLSVSFTATSDMPIGKPLVIEFQNSASATGYELNIDNVYLTGAGTGDSLPPKTQGNNGLTMVGVNLTLKVPEAYPDIPAALDYMKDKFIKAGRIVTIKVSDCTNQTFAEPIVVDHPNGDAIHIVGKSTNPADCVLNFPTSSGFVVNNQNALGLLDGFHINGNEASGSIGVRASNGGHITLGENLWVSNFIYGVLANQNASIVADAVRSFGNAQHGFHTTFNGVLHARNAVSYDNGVDGFQAHFNSLIFADYSQANNNGYRGYLSSNHSLITAEHAAPTSNGAQGFYASDMGAMISRFGAPSQNISTDFYAYHMSYLNRVSDKGGSYSPGIGSSGGNNGSVMR